MEIVQKVYHSNGTNAPFVVAIVDDPAEGDTKLVIMFEDDEYTAVKYEYALRDELWNDFDY